MVELDATGLKCPLPVLRARRALKDLPPGGVLRVRATDAAAPRDFVSFCQMTGTELLSSTVEDGVYCLVIRKPD